MSIHVAIIRRVLPGREAEFQEALRAFLQTSFGHGSVQGASMLVPAEGSGSREFGILRTFADAAQRDAFYASPLFAEWDARARTMTEGEPVYRDLHGLEAFFRSPNTPPPPRWKMAVATLTGVYPTSLLLGVTLGAWTSGVPYVVRTLLFSAAMVALLAWCVMPLVTRALRPWLRTSSR